MGAGAQVPARPPLGALRPPPAFRERCRPRLGAPEIRSPGSSPRPSAHFHCERGKDDATWRLSFLPYLETREACEAWTDGWVASHLCKPEADLAPSRSTSPESSDRAAPFIRGVLKVVTDAPRGPSPHRKKIISFLQHLETAGLS